MPGQARAHTIVRTRLQSCVLDTHRQINGRIRAEFISPCEIDLRPQIHRSHPGICSYFACEVIAAFVFAGNDRLQRYGVLVLERQKSARAAGPGEVVGKLIVEITSAADGILHVGTEESLTPARKNSRPDDSVKGTAPERQIVPVNSAFVIRNFVEFLVKAAGAAGREFYSADDGPA